MIKALLLLSSITGCASKHNYYQKTTLPSGTPCLDGVLYNLQDKSCKSFFWGYRKDTMKIRCTFSSESSWWVNTSFYFIPVSSTDNAHEEWVPYCKDREFTSFTGPTLIRVAADSPMPVSGAGFSGGDHIIEKGEVVEAN